MTWTTEKPTQPGWYWWRYSAEDTLPLVLNVIEDGNGGLEADGEEVSKVNDGEGHWAGPLEPPT